MTLHVHSDGSYLLLKKGRSREGGHNFISNTSPQLEKAKPNIAIHVLCNVLKNVMGLAAETEIAATFDNAKEAMTIRNTLEFFNHPQPPTPIQVDNTTAAQFTNKKLKQKRSKAIDMHFYWLQDRADEGKFQMHWKPGTGNLGNYHAKKHSPKHHILKQPIYLHVLQKMANLLQHKTSASARVCLSPQV